MFWDYQGFKKNGMEFLGSSLIVYNQGFMELPLVINESFMAGGESKTRRKIPKKIKHGHLIYKMYIHKILAYLNSVSERRSRGTHNV